jgi:hypothetical protein
MPDNGASRPPDLDLPFHLRGYGGRVSVFYDVNWDATRLGFDLAGMQATPLPLEIATEADWRRCAATLAEQYPGWEFDPAWEPGDSA